MQANLFTQELLFNNTIAQYVNGKNMKVNQQNLLDKYFTKSNIAKKLYENAWDVISQYEKDIDRFKWIEPSAGNGVFLNLLPKNKRIGIDISPMNDEIIKADYLNYYFQSESKSIVIGNPPFGHRGVTALNFINHSQNADYVCFILPMFFESKGKGSIKYRVKGFNLISSKPLPKNSFYTPDGKEVDIKCVFQVWSKNHKIDANEFSWYHHRNREPFSELVKVYTVSLAKNRECGKKWIFEQKADFYLSSTFYGSTVIVNEFYQVKYKSGIAVVIIDLSKKDKIIKLFKSVNWAKYSTQATNSCYHIGKSHIFQVIQDNIKSL